MLLDRSQFRDHRLSHAERRNWRFLLTLAGALVLLLAYALPFFDARITAATTRFQKDPAITLEFPFLVHGQHVTHAKTLRNGQLEAVDLSIAQVAGAPSSGMRWPLRTFTSKDIYPILRFADTRLMPIPRAGTA